MMMKKRNGILAKDMKDVWRDFCSFLRNPNTEGLTIARRATIGLFVLFVALNWASAFIKGWITNDSFVDVSDVVELQPEIMLLGGLIYPLIEELAFRSFLLFHKKKYVAISALPTLFFINSTVHIPWLQYALMLIVLVLYSVMLISQNGRAWTVRAINRHKRLLIFATSLAFGYLHLLNYSSFNPVNLFPTTGKAVGELFYSYVTVRNDSILPAWLFHAINNALPMVLTYVWSLWM